ncbi:MAG: hypothetical protein P9L99_17650 [Candidatus Lernaella stagnicola]|nr:hypothetical protein [Candidatus Lernaella stagnicola]
MRFRPTIVALLCLALFAACGADKPMPDRESALSAAAGSRLEPIVLKELALPACGAPQTPPAGYGQSEARWLVARFDENDSPFLGLYIYFWIDRYLVDGCYYHSTYGGLYTKDGGMFDNLFDGAHVTSTPVDYGAVPYYDVAVFPLLRVRRDPADERLFHITVNHPEFQAEFDIVVAHRRWWNETFFSDYDAYVTGGNIDHAGSSYEVTGRATLERWWDFGPYDPNDPAGELVEGYWLYEPFFWTGPEGRKVASIVWFKERLGEHGTYEFTVEGAVSEGENQWEIVSGEVNYDFAENAAADGYLRRHTTTLHLAGGRTFSYEVSAAKEYRDPFPGAWSRFAPTFSRKAHTFAQGSLDFDGVSFDGGGVWEWQVTSVNPLP